MQLSSAIARNSGQSWHSGIKSNSVASNLSGHYSAAIARYFYLWFWYKKVDSAYFKQQPGGKVICCLYYAFAFLLVGCMLIFLLRYMFVCSNYVAYLCPIMMALCSTFGFSLSVNNIWVALLVYIF